MSEPNVEDIVARLEDDLFTATQDDIRVLIASWRERGEALRPFAKEAGGWSDKAPDDLRPSIDTFNAARFGDYADFTIGDLRRARAALKDKP